MNISLLKLIPICVLFTLMNTALHAQDCCAFEAYSINNITNELVGVDPVTGNQTTIAPLSQNIGVAVFGGEIIDCVYYVYSSRDDVIYSIDINTGVVTSTTISCTSGLDKDIVTGLEINPTTGIFYGISPDGSCNIPTELVQIDLAAGTCTNTVPITDSNGAALTCVGGLVIDDTGQAYVTDLITTCLVPIDLATGQATGPTLPLIDPLGNPYDIRFTQGLDLDCPAGGTKLTGYIFNGTIRETEYVCIDPATGVVTTINNVGSIFGDDYTPNFAYCNFPTIEITSTCVCVGNDIAKETIVITDPLGVARGWSLSNAGGLINTNGTPSTATMTDNGDGTYTLCAFLPSDASTTYNATFTSISGLEISIQGGPCDSCCDAEGGSFSGN